MLVRDANGVPIEHESQAAQTIEESAFDSPSTSSAAGKPRDFAFGAMTHDPSNLFGAQRRREEQTPPEFMTNPDDPVSLDNVVKLMLSPDPANRPTAAELLWTSSISWVNSRRSAGAIVYEGNWGPEARSTTPDDTEMTDV
jgi:mitosis inhibitor protein kinase SWE1